MALYCSTSAPPACAAAPHLTRRTRARAPTWTPPSTPSGPSTRWGRPCRRRSTPPQTPSGPSCSCTVERQEERRRVALVRQLAIASMHLLALYVSCTQHAGSRASMGAAADGGCCTLSVRGAGVGAGAGQGSPASRQVVGGLAVLSGVEACGDPAGHIHVEVGAALGKGAFVAGVAALLEGGPRVPAQQKSRWRAMSCRVLEQQALGALGLHPAGGITDAGSSLPPAGALRA